MKKIFFSSRLGIFFGVFFFLISWEFAGQFRLVADGAFPSLTQILWQIWFDRSEYSFHTLSTIKTSVLGFFLGNLFSIILSLFMFFCRPLKKLLAGINLTVFAMPLIALVPVVNVSMSGDSPRIFLAALSVYYPTMAAFLFGLTYIDKGFCDLVRVYGGGEFSILRWVRFRNSLPIFFSGLRTSAPAAVLGSLLSEFGGGNSSGLGVYLIGSLGRAEPARLWGIGLASTAISAVAYLILSFISHRFLYENHSIFVESNYAGNEEIKGFLNPLTFSVAFFLPFLLWFFIVFLARYYGISEIIVRDPLDIIKYLFLSEDAVDNLKRLWNALSYTFPYLFFGILLSLFLTFFLAVLANFFNFFRAVILPVALITQSMPLVALAPLIVLVFGRGAFAIIAITLSVVFFPAFSIIVHGFQSVPGKAKDLVLIYGGGKIKFFKHVVIPFAMPYLFSAARLVVPRAFLGVMIAEWLATGTGIGDMLNESRGMLDYGMIWSIILVSIVVAVFLYFATVLVEHFILEKFSAKRF